MKKTLGFTLVEIMIVVAIIGLLAAIAVPAFMKARQSARRSACVNNLRILDSSKQTWALEEGGRETDTPILTNLAPYINDTNSLFCPSLPKALRVDFANSYSINVISNKPTCIPVGTSDYHVVGSTRL